MSFFDLDPKATQNLLDQARLNPLAPDDMKPGWWAGAWKAPFTGLASAVNDVALLAGDAATPIARTVARPVDELFGTKLDDWLLSEQQKAVDNIKGWAPDPRTTGVIGQTVHGLFNVIPEAIPGPEVAAALQGYKATRGGMADGLDPGTAMGVGAINAVSTWVGMKLPMQALPRFGAAGAVATGAGGNVGVGAASRGATGEWLRQNGYKDMAEQYKVLDSAAVFTDLVLGGGFGALAHYGPTAAERYQAWRDREAYQIQPSDKDAALALNNQLHVELDTAPGIPADPATRAAHIEAMNDALASLARDEPVVVRPGVTEGTFVENPTAARTREQIVEVVEDHLGPDWRALKAELEARGLPIDEIDQSGVFRPKAPEAAKPGTEPAAATPKAGETASIGDAGDTPRMEQNSTAARGEWTSSLSRDSSWVIRNKGTKEVIFETFDKAKVDALNTEKYEAVPIQKYLGELNETIAAQAALDNPSRGIPVGDTTIAARDALVQADAEIASAERDSQGFEAAAACVLRG